MAAELKEKEEILETANRLRNELQQANDTKSELEEAIKTAHGVADQSRAKLVSLQGTLRQLKTLRLRYLSACETEGCPPASCVLRAAKRWRKRQCG